MRSLALYARLTRTASAEVFHPLSQQRSYGSFFSATTPLHSGFRYRRTRVLAEDAIDPLTKPSSIDKGALHVVSVPIGNLKDFTIRALDVLHDVDYIITTDRPATKALLDLVHVPNQGRLVHYSKTNHTATRAKLVELLKGGRSLAFVTTSGTPCVGDVGGELVREMQANGIRVTAVPGASAVMSALAISGSTSSPHENAGQSSGSSDADGGSSSPLEVSPAAVAHALGGGNGAFYFGNMLPENHGARLRVLRNTVGTAVHPCVFYEVPRRLVSVLQDIAAVLPRRRVCVMHELTKLNESLHADTAEALVSFYTRHEAHMLLTKGQVVIVIGGAGPAELAAFLEQEAQRRRRLRKSLDTLMETNGNNTGEAATKEGSDRKGKSKTTRSKRALLRERRKAALRRKRERLIHNIEKEQERLRLKFSINRADAKKI